MDENQQEVLMDLDLCEVVTNKRYSMTEMSASGEDSGKKSTDSGTTSQSVKDSLKQRLSQNASIATSSNKTEMLPVESQGASNDPWLNPSLLEEVLAEKKLALMRSPEVVHFLQSQQAKIAMETKTSLLQDSNKINKS